MSSTPYWGQTSSHYSSRTLRLLGLFSTSLIVSVVGFS